MMGGIITLILTGLLRGVRTQRSLVFENLVLRHQLAVLQRTAPRPRLRTADRLFFSEAGCQEHCSLVVSPSSLCPSSVRPTAACGSGSLCEVCHPSLRAVGGKWQLACA
jgi:hypothetical protein